MRVKQIVVSAEFIIEQLTTGRKLPCDVTVLSGLPEGAILVGHGYDYNTHQLILNFEHESFEDLEIGALIPRLAIMLTKEIKPTEDHGYCPHCGSSGEHL